MCLGGIAQSGSQIQLVKSVRPPQRPNIAGKLHEAKGAARVGGLANVAQLSKLSESVLQVSLFTDLALHTELLTVSALCMEMQSRE